MDKVRSRHVAALLAGVGALFLAAGLAYATIPDSGGVIHGCFAKSGGTLRVIDASVTGCKQTETSLDWNVQGQKGDPGEPATDLWAVVDSPQIGPVSLVRGSGVVAVGEGTADNGAVDVHFDRDISGCAFAATVGDHDGFANGEQPVTGSATASFVFENPTVVRVLTRTADTGAAVDMSFGVAVFC
jgi:hypothetical protein